MRSTIASAIITTGGVVGSTFPEDRWLRLAIGIAWAAASLSLYWINKREVNRLSRELAARTEAAAAALAIASAAAAAATAAHHKPKG
jgi:hypothetical protein